MDRKHRPKPSHHASTIVEVEGGSFVAAWFAGRFEGKSDVGIFVSRLDSSYDGNWTSPVEVVKPVGGIPTWNPVLFRNYLGEVLLFYKTGREPKSWRGYVKTSKDNGVTWSEPSYLGHGIIGPAKNKPILVGDEGRILSPSSREKRNRVWSCVMEESLDHGKTWKTLTGPIEHNWKEIQPSVFVGDDGNIRMVARSRSSYMVSAVSDGEGREWSKPSLTKIPCPNSGLDATKLKDGRVVLVYNHSFKKGGWSGRGVLSLAISNDDGDSWEPVMTLEDSHGRNVEFSSPAVIQSSDGLIHTVYTWKRHNIRHLIIDPKLIKTGEELGEKE